MRRPLTRGTPPGSTLRMIVAALDAGALELLAELEALVGDSSADLARLFELLHVLSGRTHRPAAAPAAWEFGQVVVPGAVDGRRVSGGRDGSVHVVHLACGSP